MKFAFKSIVAAAAFVAVGAASAAPTFLNGSGSLTFSTDALSALSASGSSILTATPIGAGLPGAGAANTAAYTKASGNVALTFSGATLTADNTALTSLTAANSLVDIRRSVFNDDGSVSQYNVYLSNFKVDLASATIFADLYTNTGTGSTLVSKGNLAIYTASGFTGGTINQTTGAASGSLTGNLKFNAATADIVLVGLGLDTTGPVADLVKNSNWGTTSASGTFAVPEPSTYALMGIGLVGIAAAARRRRAA